VRSAFRCVEDRKARAWKWPGVGAASVLSRKGAESREKIRDVALLFLDFALRIRISWAKFSSSCSFFPSILVARLPRLAAARLAGMPRVRALAVDASVVRSPPSLEAATLAAWRVASAAARHRTERVVVYTPAGGDAADGRGAACLARLLQYLETPPYLRRALVPRHPDLAKVGALPRNNLGLAPLMPHHLRCHQRSRYREGVVIPDPSSESRTASALADVGLRANVRLDCAVKVGVRVTTALDDVAEGHLRAGEANLSEDEHHLSEDARERERERGDGAPASREPTRRVRVVSPDEPGREGRYWGFTVRFASGTAAEAGEGTTHDDEGTRYRILAPRDPE
jgi:predicted SPOUT superfamily RNA methylase MTH1